MWWSIYQEGVEVTELSGNGETPKIDAITVRSYQTKKHKTVVKAQTETQKLYKRKVKNGYKAVEGRQAFQPPEKLNPETYSAFLTCETKSDVGGKFWAVQQDKQKLTIRYGPIGADGTITNKQYDSINNAHEQANKMANKKKNEGYLLIQGKEVIVSTGDATAVAIDSLEQAMALPIRITGHLRSLGDHTSDWVIKFVLERQQKETSGDWSFALLHQQCGVHDSQWRRSAPENKMCPWWPLLNRRKPR